MLRQPMAARCFETVVEPNFEMGRDYRMVVVLVEDESAWVELVTRRLALALDAIDRLPHAEARCDTF